MDKPLSIVLISIFATFSIIHLIFAFFEMEKLRKITKPLIFLPLLGLSFVIDPSFHIFLLGLIFGIIGDVFLIFKDNKKIFTIGAFFFFFGHLLYGVQILALYPLKNEWWFYLIMALALVVLVIFLPMPFVKKIKPYAKGLSRLLLMYFSTLLFLLLISIGLIIFTPYKLCGVFTAIGFLLFATSDTILSYSIFKQDFKRKDFYIMLTYILAQTSIVLAFILFIN